MFRNRPGGGRVRLAAACAATLAILGPLGWLWQDSLLPETYSVMDMGFADYGGGPGGSAGHQAHAAGAASAQSVPGGHAGAARDVKELVADPDRRADVSLTMIARKQRFTLPSGRAFDGFTLNGGSPGPVIEAIEGQLVEVRLVNESVPGGVTLHWHGVDVPNAADGVAGVTQDAVGVGEEFTYRFVADQVGTFWYHSHQMSHEQVRRGMLGALVISPKGKAADKATDVTALVHLYGGVRTVNGYEGDVKVKAAPGARARVRVINTEYGVMPVWVSGAPYRLAAIDGTEVNGAAPVPDKALVVTAGGRVDLEVTMPEDGSPVRVHLGGPAGVVLGSASYDAPPVTRPKATLDPLTYGTRAPLGFDPGTPDRRFVYDIGRRPGFLDGVPGLWWTINGYLYPDVPMFHVAEGDVVRMRIANNSGEAHPMHLHGHHAVVLSRDGVPATGSPWWVDSLEVAAGESYEIAFVADNPGVWMDHCHNLPHASEGLSTHLMYEGVRTSYTVGGPAGNVPE